jgi:hypothetical protein
MLDAYLYQRLIKKLDRPEGDRCWLWQGAKTRGGYGQVYVRGLKMVPAHRAMWIATHGTISAGKVICHKCDNRLCCRPDHLFIGSQRDNNEDRDAKGRGVPFGRLNARDRLENRSVANEIWERATSIDDHDLAGLGSLRAGL